MNKFSRRGFLTTTSAAALGAAAFPSIIPVSACGAKGEVSAANQLNVGCIGAGERGQDVLSHFLRQSNCRVLALCDVKSDVLARAKAKVDRQYKNQDCRTYADFRELLERPDLDAVLIASTDHWHVLHALASVRAGKDVYVEKPLGLSLAEDQELRREVRRHRRIFQFGTQQRSDRKFRLACELVRNGHIGKLKHINVWAPGSHPGGATAAISPPNTLDYERWLGPAQFRPYTQDLTAFEMPRKTWWFISEFALGFIAGWGVHPIDIALWGAGNLAAGKIEIEGQGHFPKEGACNTATTWKVHFKFPSGLTMQFVGVPYGSPDEKFEQKAEWLQRYRAINDHGTAFEGTDGWVHVDRTRINLQPEELIDCDPAKFKSKLVYSPDHVQNFLESVRTRKETVCPVEEAVRSDLFCHLADIAIRLQRKVVFDLAREKFVDDKVANERLKARSMRAPWKL